VAFGVGEPTCLATSDRSRKDAVMRLSSPTTRRFHLGLWGGLLTSAGGIEKALAAARADLTDPETKLDALIRLRCRADGHPTFIQYQGTIFGKREGEKAAPLFGVIGSSWSKASRAGPGRYALVTTEAGYFTDLSSGAVLEHWVNPLNGLDTTVKHYKSTQKLLVLADRVESIRGRPLPEGFEYTGIVPPAVVIGDQLWMSEDLLVRIPSPAKASFSDPREYFGPFTTATSLASWTAPLSSVMSARRSFVGCTLAYQTLGSWRPFMLMGDAPGLISWRMYGLKLEQFQQIGPGLRSRILADHPDFLDGA
jgi:hypothetical protein